MYNNLNYELMLYILAQYTYTNISSKYCLNKQLKKYLNTQK